ncbi:ABC transporter ATP-binding protein [Pararhizobium sp. LjRoot235]|uniref:ABC transporter ATP-binding protein n=1 Tax=Pararhizobium sp. LjRoot235 TaxID=3342291 RepID=UPI003ED070E6
MNALLEVRNLRKQFGGLVAVNGVSFTLEKGEVVGLLGPNGSGKTTVMNLISGALSPTAGEILLAGEGIHGAPAHRIARKGVSRTFQLVRLAPSLSVRDNVILSIAFGRKPLWGRAARERADLVLTTAGLAGQGDLPVQTLNYIDQKRLELARAIAPCPDILLLDEWLAGLNPAELRVGIELIRGLRDTGITILLVEHIMEAVRELCARAIVMSSGITIADGPTREVLADPTVVAAYLGDSEYA